MPSEPRGVASGPARTRPRRFRALAAAGTLLLSLAWGAPLPQASYGEQKVEENDLKAVYLYNFLQFVQWPESRRGAPLVIGVVGETPLARALEALQASLEKGGKRPIRVVRFGAWREGLDLGSCHLLFLAPSEQPEYGRILAGLSGTPVLTVADDGDFLEAGGMIALTVNQGKLRWMINRPPADRAGLRFNAQMLRLAIKVVE